MKTLFAALALAACAGLSAAQEFPAKPVRVIVPFTPGGPNDLVVRPVSEKLIELTKHPFIVE